MRAIFSCLGTMFLAASHSSAAWIVRHSSSKSLLLSTKTKQSLSLPRARWMTSSFNTEEAAGAEALRGKVRLPIETAIAHHGASNVHFLDGSWWLGDAARGRLGFEKGPIIRGANFFDIDDIAMPMGSPGNPKNLPHMMPTAELFGRCMDWFSIKDDDHIVVYGQKGCPFLFRAYFQIFAMGHKIDRLHLLDGSLQDWIDAAGPVDPGPVQTVYAKDLMKNTNTSSPPLYKTVEARNVVDMDEMKRLASRAGSGDETTVVVDVRSPDRFYGRVDEPRPGLRRGHLPGSINLFFQDLLDSQEPTKLLPTDELRRLIQERVPLVNDESRIVSLCGSGATACILATALLDIGVDPKRVWIYDGSWAEWGADPDVPIVANQEQEA